MAQVGGGGGPNLDIFNNNGFRELFQPHLQQVWSESGIPNQSDPIEDFKCQEMTWAQMNQNGFKNNPIFLLI
jgi:hypothetical protein